MKEENTEEYEKKLVEMNEEFTTKISMVILLPLGVVCWTFGYFTDNWSLALCGLAMLVGACGAWTNLRLYRIEKKLGIKK